MQNIALVGHFGNLFFTLTGPWWIGWQGSSRDLKNGNWGPRMICCKKGIGPGSLKYWLSKKIKVLMQNIGTGQAFVVFIFSMQDPLAESFREKVKT